MTNIQNTASLRSDEATTEELAILVHQNVNDSATIGHKGIARIDIKRQMGKTFVYPIPSGKVFALDGNVSTDDAQDWFLSKLTDAKKDSNVKS